MAAAYMLYYYDEHGPERLRLTLDRRSLPVMLSEMGASDRLENLIERLSHSDDELAGDDGIHRLDDGWGGITLQVVKIEES